MAKKAGRPAGSKNKVGKDEKEFIKGLLGETQEQFRKEFIRLASSCDVENPTDRQRGDRFRFMEIRRDLSKMVVPKPVEIDATIQSSDFEELMGLCSKWDDESDS